MKKMLWLFILLLLLGAFYVAIPNHMSWTKTKTLTVNTKAFNRLFSDETNWIKWWPGGKTGTGTKGEFVLNGNVYRIVSKQFTSFTIKIATKHGVVNSELLFIPVAEDSLNLNWAAGAVTSYNPIEKAQRFFAMKSLQKDMDAVLQSIKTFHQNIDNFYGFQIKKDHVVDSLLIQTSSVSKDYPSTQSIYSLIDKLQAYAAAKGARQTGLPMLNIYSRDSTNYRIQVALPVDKKLPDENDISYRWMLGGGNILVVDVTGGPGTINNAFAEMENYVHDNNRMPPAIPFQSLVTDRRTEPDTSKWITKLYWPVM